jgi:CHASE2 domain-containing sensor protein
MAVVGVLLLNVAWPLPGQEDGRPWAAGFMAFPVAGSLILMRRPCNRIGLVLSVVGAGAGAIFFGSWAALQYMHEPWSPYVEALLPAALAVQFWGLLSLLYLFPSGSPPREARVGRMQR